jgi:hypothetical protein
MQEIDTKSNASTEAGKAEPDDSGMSDTVRASVISAAASLAVALIGGAVALLTGYLQVDASGDTSDSSLRADIESARDDIEALTEENESLRAELDDALQSNSGAGQTSSSSNSTPPATAATTTTSATTPGISVSPDQMIAGRPPSITVGVMGFGAGEEVRLEIWEEDSDGECNDLDGCQVLKDVVVNDAGRSEGIVIPLNGLPGYMVDYPGTLFVTANGLTTTRYASQPLIVAATG